MEIFISQKEKTDIFDVLDFGLKLDIIDDRSLISPSILLSWYNLLNEGFV